MMSNGVAVECPLEVEDNGDAVTHRELNALIRRVGMYHLTPMKEKLDAANKSMEAHVLDCALRQQQIMGGLTVLKWLVSSGLLAFALNAAAKYMGWW